MILTEEIARHARVRPEALAFTWIEGDALEPARQLSYRELHAQVERLAAALRAQRLEGRRVLLSFPPGLDFIVAFFGCLSANAVAVPAPFPQNRRTLARTRAMAMK